MGSWVQDTIKSLSAGHWCGHQSRFAQRRLILRRKIPGKQRETGHPTGYQESSTERHTLRHTQSVLPGSGAVSKPSPAWLSAG